MANVTRDISITKSAYAKQAWPNNKYATSSGTNYLISSDDGKYNGYNKLYFGGAGSWPSSLKRKRIIKAQVRVRVCAGSGAVGVSVCSCKDFTASALTYNNAPEPTNFDGYASAASLGISAGTWTDALITIEDSSADYLAKGAIGILKNGAFYIESGYYTSLIDSPWYAKIVLSNNSNPYLRITYDDAVDVTSQVQFVSSLGSSTKPNQANSITWKLVKNSSYFCYDETWTQSSAKFRWRVQGASSWNDINVSGSTMSATIPAYTFPTGKTIEYCVQCTDADGTTTTTTTYTTTTPASQITQQNSPTSGYKNPRDPITFSWYFSNTAGSYEQQSASLFWRENGTSTWTEVPASGSTMSVTVPANTFPTGSAVQWYLYGTDSSGSSSQTPVYTFSTSASIIDAVCKMPVGNVEDGSAPIRFVWELWSTDGYPASRTIFQWKKGSDPDIPANWHTEMDVSQTVTDITVNAGVFPAGEIDWKVVAYNIDGTEGTWGEASFVCVSAPDPVLGLAATPVPLTTISWQSDGQEAYEISIDGEVVQRAWGAAVYSWTVQEPLSEGVHTIQVRIQGIYELWSQPAETSIQVAGPAGTMELTGDFNLDAVLYLNYGTNARIRWYRDGTLIGTSQGSADGANFTDRHVLGEHSYFARIFYGDGTYLESNPVTGTMSTMDTVIAALDGGEWISLRLTDASRGSESFTWSKTVSKMHVAGAVYPVLETSPYEDLSGSYSCAFRYDDEAMAFEALRGKTVILKSRRGIVMVGALSQLQKRVRRFIVSYSFTLQQIQWEDLVAYDEGD